MIDTAVMATALVGFIVPNAGTSAATLPAASTLIGEWSKAGTTRTYQEKDARLTYRGSWATAAYPSYLGGKAKWSRDPLARASFQFTGKAVAWIGPVGPTRGKAKVYVDGRYVKTVDTHASAFRSTRVLFTASFATVKARVLTLVVCRDERSSGGGDRCPCRADRPYGGCPRQPTTVPIIDDAPTPTLRSRARLDTGRYRCADSRPSPRDPLFRPHLRQAQRPNRSRHQTQRHPRPRGRHLACPQPRRRRRSRRSPPPPNPTRSLPRAQRQSWCQFRAPSRRRRLLQRRRLSPEWRTGSSKIPGWSAARAGLTR